MPAGTAVGGLWAASASMSAHGTDAAGLLVILCSLGNCFVQATWVQYADKPESAGLYKELEWMPRLKQQVGDGSVSFTRPEDKDYLHANHLSTFESSWLRAMKPSLPNGFIPPGQPGPPGGRRQGRHFPYHRQSTPKPAAS
ncbi:MAG: hypothetical protein ACLRPT_02470 [Akkermansia muciniphila]